MNAHDPDRHVPATPLSVADILRREGLRGPHAASGRLRPRGHAGPPVTTLSAPRPPGQGRALAAVAALTVAGAVLGAAALQDAVRPGEAEAGGDTAAAGIADGRSAEAGDPAGTPAVTGIPADLVALVTDLVGPGDGAFATGADLARLATAGTGSGGSAGGAPRIGDGSRPAPVGPGANALAGGSGARAGGTGAPAGIPSTGAGGGPGTGSGSGGPGEPAGGSGGRPDAGGAPGGGAAGGGAAGGGAAGGGAPGGGGAPATVALPELRAPDAVPAAPAIRPGAVSVAPDEARITGPAVTTEPAQVGPVAVGRTEVEAPEASLSTSGRPGVALSGAEVETPRLNVAGVEADPPDLATPGVGVRLPLG